MTLVRHFVSVLTICCYVAATVNVPLPAPSASAELDFPCQFHGCGCVDAVMCRTQCCCIKPVQPVKRVASCCNKAKKPLPGCPLPTAATQVAASPTISPNTPPESEPQQPRPAQQTGGWTIGAMKCRGLMPTFAAIGPVAPIEPGRLALLEPIMHVVAIMLVTAIISQYALDPPAPPPRSHA